MTSLSEFSKRKVTSALIWIRVVPIIWMMNAAFSHVVCDPGSCWKEVRMRHQALSHSDTHLLTAASCKERRMSQGRPTDFYLNSSKSDKK